jgi:hypothetical protein
MAMTGYTKLFNSILASTIWREDDKTRQRRPTGSALPAATPNDPAAYALAAMEGD